MTKSSFLFVVALVAAVSASGQMLPQLPEATTSVALVAAVEAIVTGPPADAHAALRSLCFDTGPDGDSNPVMVLADVVSAQQLTAQTRSGIGGEPVYATFEPEALRKIEANKPQFTVDFSEDKAGFYINRQKFEMNAGPMLTVNVGVLQHWRIVNSTKEVHPFHIHQVHFLVYAIDGKPVENPVWLDTVNVSYGSSVDLVMDFTDPIIRGMSLFHCHAQSRRQRHDGKNSFSLRTNRHPRRQRSATLRPLVVSRKREDICRFSAGLFDV